MRVIKQQFTVFVFLLACLWACLCVVLLPQAVLAQSENIIQFIKVQGTQRVEEETVKAYMLVRPGMVDNAKLIDQSIKTLFASGLFADVSIKREQGGLTVIVVENPIVNRVEFEGNSAIRSDKLQEEGTLKPRQIYTRAKVQDDVERFIELYRRSGRFAARIDPKVIQLPQNRIDLIFEINEGDVTKIRAINFIGNQKYSDARLKDEIVTEESAWWKFLTSNDNYDPDRVAYDRELLRRFYVQHGYADFRVVSSLAELTRDGKEFFITFNIEEGPLYDFGKSEVVSNIKDLDAKRLEQAVTHAEGDRYNADKIDSTIDKITKIVGEAGFAFADIRPRTRRDAENSIIEISYVINEGPRVYVERININGNSRTQDHVIRREIRLDEEDAFNQVLLSRSERNIKALDYFKTVEVVQQPGSAPDRTIIDVNVAEQPTGQVTFGVGFSSSDSYTSEFSISERNLLGRGYKLGSSLRLSSRQQDISVAFTDPYFLNRDVAAGVRVYNSQTDYQYQASNNIETQKSGLSLSLSYNLSENGRLSLFSNMEQDKFINRSATTVLSRSFDTTKVEFGYFYFYDVRDDVIDPTDGWNFGFGQDVAGPLGNETYLRTTATGNFYEEIFEGWIFHARLTAGHIFDYDRHFVPYNDRFFRTSRDFRGFKRNGVGPREITTDSILGANQYLIGTTQMRLPLGLPKEVDIKTNAFIDFGWLGKTDINKNINTSFQYRDDFAFRATYGISVAWRSPVGPIRFDFARPITVQPYDKPQSFRFSIGTSF